MRVVAKAVPRGGAVSLGVGTAAAGKNHGERRRRPVSVDRGRRRAAKVVLQYSKILGVKL
jgi:hypothetical protein